jgi:hypothetical protein
VAPNAAKPTGYRRTMRGPSGTRSKESLPPAVIAWRAAHGLIAAAFLTSIGYVWWCALSGRRGRFLRPAIAALVGEGALVVANRGDCPLARLGDGIGDPVPLFELVLSPRAARLAVPTLGVLTAAGLGLLANAPRTRVRKRDVVRGQLGPRLSFCSARRAEPRDSSFSFDRAEPLGEGASSRRRQRAASLSRMRRFSPARVRQRPPRQRMRLPVIQREKRERLSAPSLGLTATGLG